MEVASHIHAGCFLGATSVCGSHAPTPDPALGGIPTGHPKTGEELRGTASSRHRSPRTWAGPLTGKQWPGPQEKPS